MAKQSNPQTSTPVTPAALTPAPVEQEKTVSPVESPKPAEQPVKILTQKDQDMAKLEKLQSKYSGLKKKVEGSVRKGTVDKEALAVKGDVTREIDALKRRYDLP